MKTETTTNDSRTDWDRLAKMSDAEIDFSDIPELDEEKRCLLLSVVPRKCVEK